MTSNPVRASESQDEAEPLLGDAEEKYANSIPFATTVLIIMAALSALGTLTLRETMGERLS